MIIIIYNIIYIYCLHLLYIYIYETYNPLCTCTCIYVLMYGIICNFQLLATPMKALIEVFFSLRCHYIKRQILPHLLNICQKYLRMAISSLETVLTDWKEEEVVWNGRRKKGKDE